VSLLANAVQDPSPEFVGAWIVTGSAVVAVAVAFLGRTRLPWPVVTVLLAIGGAGLGLGGMIIRGAASLPEVVAAIVLLAVLVPAHVRIVLGPFGPRGAGRQTAATTPEEPP
jgi:uncharacterized membrane protein